MEKFLIILILSLFTISCTTSGGKDVFIILNHEQLSSDKNRDAYIIGRSSSIIILDSLILIQDMRNYNIYHLVLTNGCYLGGYGEKGQGPNEFLLPSSFCAFNNNSVGFYDINKRIYSIIDIKNEKSNFENKFSICDSFFPFYVYPVLKDCYLAVGKNCSKRFSLLNYQGECIDVFYEYPFRDNKEKMVSSNIRSEVYQGKIAVNNSKNKFAHAMTNANILSFYELKDEKVKLIKEILESYPDYKYNPDMIEFTGISAKNPVAYLDVFATDNNVYALYSGKNYADYAEKSALGREISVYNWQGELTQIYKLDVDVACICVDNHDETMYAIANNPDPQIVKFALNK